MSNQNETQAEIIRKYFACFCSEDACLLIFRFVVNKGNIFPDDLMFLWKNIIM